jgi:hypothetical protein
MKFQMSREVEQGPERFQEAEAVSLLTWHSPKASISKDMRSDTE